MSTRKRSKSAVETDVTDSNRAATGEPAQEVSRLQMALEASRDYQRAISEILRAMSDSPGNAQPVFDAIVRNLNLLFKTEFSAVQLLDDGVISMPALDGNPVFCTWGRNTTRGRWTAKRLVGRPCADPHFFRAGCDGHRERAPCR